MVKGHISSSLLYVAVLTLSSCSTLHSAQQSMQRFFNSDGMSSDDREALQAKREAALQVGTSYEDFCAAFGLPNTLTRPEPGIEITRFKVFGEPMFVVFKDQKLVSYEVDQDEKQRIYERAEARRIAEERASDERSRNAAAWGAALSGLAESNRQNYQNNQIPTRKTTTCRRQFDGSMVCEGY